MRSGTRGRWRAVTAAAGLATVAVALTACAPAATTPKAPSSKPPASSASTTDPAATTESGPRVTADSLPLDVGTRWEIAQKNAKDGVPVKFDVKGPWVLEAGADWSVASNEIVDPGSVPEIAQFSGYDYVVKSTEPGAEKYLVHQVERDWVMILGSVASQGGRSAATVEPSPAKYWPLDFEVGQQLNVSEDAAYRVTASVLARNTATVPAGVIKDAYLVRFDFEPLGDSTASPSAYYYLLAPKVGFVGLVVPRTGNEATGFISANFVQVLKTLPQR